MPVINRLNYPERVITDPFPGLTERMAAGKEIRTQVERESYAEAVSEKHRPDPVQLLIDSNEGRIEQLVPIRYGRMLHSPFAFLRGSAIIMADDLSRLPCSGIYVQCCGDCHLMNFGGYATPERNLVFDINDFDETLPAPFEWDVKRLASSVVIAGRYRGFSDKDNRKAALSAVQMYTQKIREFASMRQLEIWYNRIDEAAVIEFFKSDKDFVARVKESGEKSRLRTHEFLFPKISHVDNGQRKIIDSPPLIYHPPDMDDLLKHAHTFFEDYFDTLSNDKKSLLNRFRLEDFAWKIVGVGSVGTRCLIALFSGGEDDAIILQFKEGRKSVLERAAGQSEFKNHGERIVIGQQLMQTISDIFLGWSKTRNGVDFYVRQLRDMKSSANIDNFNPRILTKYSMACGWALAKSHAKAGRAPEITGYIGKTDAFAGAVTEFALSYADRTEKDFELLQAAEKSGRITANHEH